MEESNEKKKKEFKIPLYKLIIIVVVLIIIIGLLAVVIYRNVTRPVKIEAPWMNDPMLAKPVIYLYPEKTTEINVKLGRSEKITCSYPKYEEKGWNVMAQSNGKLTDINTGRELYCLYWEGKGTTFSNDMIEGFVVKGENTAKFLEEKLEILGLTQKEAQEFIIYWLPKMEDNKYNYIRFETIEEINKNMPLVVEPVPDTIIRINMEWKALDEYIEVEEQVLERAEARTGFTVVEWGGTRIE